MFCCKVLAENIEDIAQPFEAIVATDGDQSVTFYPQVVSKDLRVYSDRERITFYRNLKQKINNYVYDPAINPCYIDVRFIKSIYKDIPGLIFESRPGLNKGTLFATRPISDADGDRLLNAVMQATKKREVYLAVKRFIFCSCVEYGLHKLINDAVGEFSGVKFVSTWVAAGDRMRWMYISAPDRLMLWAQSMVDESPIGMAMPLYPDFLDKAALLDDSVLRDIPLAQILEPLVVSWDNDEYPLYPTLKVSRAELVSHLEKTLPQYIQKRKHRFFQKDRSGADILQHVLKYVHDENSYWPLLRTGEARMLANEHEVAHVLADFVDARNPRGRMLRSSVAVPLVKTFGAASVFQLPNDLYNRHPSYVVDIVHQHPISPKLQKDLFMFFRPIAQLLAAQVQKERRRLSSAAFATIDVVLSSEDSTQIEAFEVSNRSDAFVRMAYSSERQVSLIEEALHTPGSPAWNIMKKAIHSGQLPPQEIELDECAYELHITKINNARMALFVTDKTKQVFERDHNSVTGLYNQFKMRELLEQRIIQAYAHKKPISVFFFDLNWMKEVNDFLGHEQGNVYLQLIASVLRKEFRATDVLCHPHGDEFVVFTEGLLPEDIPEVCERLRLSAIKEKIELSPNKVRLLSYAVGISVFSNWDSFKDIKTTMDTLLLQAESAMKAAKNPAKTIESRIYDDSIPLKTTLHTERRGTDVS